MSYLITLAIDMRCCEQVKKTIDELLQKRDFKKHPSVNAIWTTTSPKAVFTEKLLRTFSEPLGWDKGGIEWRWRTFIGNLGLAGNQPLDIRTFMQIADFGWVSTNIKGSPDDLKFEITCEPLLPQGYASI